ncbi:MAG: hypothetical protein LBH60_02050 [Prevotellaceae bacterium]|nr:hypothetical protein [Prevotellaceae bacterium]
MKSSSICKHSGVSVVRYAFYTFAKINVLPNTVPDISISNENPENGFHQRKPTHCFHPATTLIATIPSVIAGLTRNDGGNRRRYGRVIAMKGRVVAMTVVVVALSASLFLFVIDGLTRNLNRGYGDCG